LLSKLDSLKVTSLVCMASLVLMSCSTRPSKESATGDRPTELNVCTSSTSSTTVTPTFALDKGIFDKYGLKVTVTQIDSGSRSVAAMISGDVQLCQMSGSAVVNAVVAGADLAIIAGLVNNQVYSLMVPAGIRSAADLKGKAVSVSAPGSGSESGMRSALKILGLRPDRDVAILAIGGQAERMAALEAGYVAGTLVSPPETTLARRKGHHTLLDMSTMDLPLPHTTIATSRAFIKSDRATVLSFMKAISEAVFMMKQDRESSLETLSKYLQVDRSREAASLEETFEVIIKGKMADKPYPAEAGIEALLREISAESPSAAEVKPEQITDSTIVRELEDSGFFRDLFRRKR